ncbi:hypothetical protein FB00_11280 [Cellulosimicrobium funkei]|uniref:DUF927 domain-containing protein n=1 Tax=Cellulosimicrobium funkei TaxID=264251 RepID=A0A0H2KM62_9MICO|nr:hypothetical protein [Cellulosimicrobium funkei]KLN34581.1 hypothetical protein FB00_11280 [Cellulosimicrobium funkei]
MTGYAIDLDLSLNQQEEMLHKAVETCNRKHDLLELPDGSLGRVVDKHGEFVYHPFREERLNSFLMNWVVPSKKTLKKNADNSTSWQTRPETAIPQTLLRAYIGAEAHPGVPRVTRMAPAPIVRPMWTLAWEQGYDPDSETFVTRKAPVTPAWRDRPIEQKEVRVAAGRLMEWFDEFALKHESSRADCLALALTPLIVSAIPTATIPGGLVMANRQGSGKTALAEVIGTMGSGAKPDAQALPGEAEIEKRITATLRDGDAGVVLFDNIKHDLNSPSLESVLTSRSFTGRVLGRSEKIRLKNNVTWLFTMNGASASPDMLRRLILIPLDLESPTRTAWSGGVVDRARMMADDLRMDLVLLIAYWVQQGCTQGSVVKSGYETWSRTVSGILEAAGVKGFYEAHEETAGSVYTEDEDDADVVARIAKVMGTEETWQAKDLWERVDQVDALNTPEGRFLHEWLRDTPKGSKMAAGRKLARITRRYYNYELRNVGTKGGAWYRLAPVGAPAIQKWSM